MVRIMRRRSHSVSVGDVFVRAGIKKMTACVNSLIVWNVGVERYIRAVCDEWRFKWPL